MVNGRSLEEELNRIDEFFDKLSDEELDSIIDENLSEEDKLLFNAKIECVVAVTQTAHGCNKQYK